jgi:cephalosporin-C deacetylase
MKKFLTTCTIILTMIVAIFSVHASETVLWEGTYTDDGVEINSETVATLKAGDVLRVYVNVPEGGANFKIVYKGSANNWAETTIPSIDNQWPWVNGDEAYKEFTLTEADITALSGMNIYVYKGENSTITKVAVIKAASSDDDTPAVGKTFTAWTGEKVFTATWEKWEKIEASAFANAQTGMLLRAKFKAVGAGAQLKFGDSDWEVLVGTEIVNITGIYQQFVITDEMLTKLQTGGLIISGTSFTLTSIEVINPADIKTLSLSVPVQGNWIFSELPSFTIHVENPYDEAVTANAIVCIVTDKAIPVDTLTKSVEIAAKGTEDIVLTCTEMPAAGFYQATCFVNDDLARAFCFGVKPTEIVSAPDMQSDFDAFWKTAKDELAAIEETDEPVLTKIDSKSTEKRTVYLVEFKSIRDSFNGEPVTVRGYYAEPTDGKKHPVIMHYLGYDSAYRPGGQDAMPWCPDGDGDELSGNYAEFVLSTRGQSINNRPAADRADGINRDFTNTYGDWFAFNFGKKDNYYYRGAYMDCVRAIDFMATRETSDMTNLYAEGQSQGGAFTYAAAALSGREFKAIAPGIAFMGDFPDYFQIVNWPANVARENQGTMTDDEMYAFLSYFDTKNLATLISNKTAVIATISVQDNVCPPHTNIAPYNNLPEGTVKEISFNPENAHQVANDWYTVYMNYFKSKYEEVQNVPEPIVPLFNENGIADLTRIEVQNAEKVTYNAETHTVTTTEGWTGIQLTVSEGEEISGKELRITFASATQIKAYVKYADDTDKDTIMAEAAEVLYFPLDGSKKLYQIQMQPTEATSFTINEIAVNQESTKPVLKPLAEGESRTLFESEDGVELSWNEIASMNEEWGSVIEAGEHLYITIKSRKAEEEWPNVVLRDATSTAIGDGILLNEVEVFPYVVKMILTDEMVSKMRQGFRFSGTGVVVTSIVLYKPMPAKEGDITIDALNFFRDGSYNPETYTVTTTARRGEVGWQIGDERYADKTLVIIDFETTNFPVTLKMEYTNTEGTRLATSAGVAAGKTEVQLALPLDVKTIDKVYLTYAEPASLVLTDASVIAAANARPLTGEPIATAIRELTIDRQESHVYNLKGLRVFNNNKGLLIQQGKKILVK